MIYSLSEWKKAGLKDASKLLNKEQNRQRHIAWLYAIGTVLLIAAFFFGFFYGFFVSTLPVGG